MDEYVHESYGGEMQLTLEEVLVNCAFVLLGNDHVERVISRKKKEIRLWINLYKTHYSYRSTGWDCNREESAF
jgi:hypothetical protein